jgi:hypothetical protein
MLLWRRLPGLVVVTVAQAAEVVQVLALALWRCPHPPCQAHSNLLEAWWVVCCVFGCRMGRSPYKRLGVLGCEEG